MSDKDEPEGFDFLAKKLESALGGSKDELANGILNEIESKSLFL